MSLRARIGRALFPDPEPFDTYEGWERLQHRDLALLDRETLLRELGLAKLRLLLDPSPSDWLHERVARLKSRLGTGGRR
jgi:hypothetical protein